MESRPPNPVRLTGGGHVLIEDLARDAADLLSVGNSGQMRSLNRLAELAVREVAGCCGATAILWRDGELVGLTTTHPDLAELAELQLRAGEGPAVQAMRDGQPVTIRDTLRDTRWPDYMGEALCRGVRSTTVLVHEFPPLTVVLVVVSVRPMRSTASRSRSPGRWPRSAAPCWPTRRPTATPSGRPFSCGTRSRAGPWWTRPRGFSCTPSAAPRPRPWSACGASRRLSTSRSTDVAKQVVAGHGAVPQG